MSISGSFFQWPAMVASFVAAYLVASTDETKRKWGFWVFLLSNVLWVIWGVSDKAYAVVVLQILLAMLNIRGVKKAKEEAEAS
jgi:hypothetical protein